MTKGQSHGSRSDPDVRYNRWAKRFAVTVENLLAGVLHVPWVPPRVPYPIDPDLAVTTLRVVARLPEQVSEQEADVIFTAELVTRQISTR